MLDLEHVCKDSVSAVTMKADILSKSSILIIFKFF